MELPEIGPRWLLISAAIMMLIALAEAWLVTLILYAKVGALKKLFPASHNLIRSHVDYTIMTALSGMYYLVVEHLALTIPDWVIVIYCVGVLYNPAGFIAKAINPKMGNSDSVLGRLLVCLGFVPATLGFGYLSLAILSATLVA